MPRWNGIQAPVTHPVNEIWVTHQGLMNKGGEAKGMEKGVWEKNGFGKTFS